MRRKWLQRTGPHVFLLVLVLVPYFSACTVQLEEGAWKIVWCGWRFNFAFERACGTKRVKLILQTQKLLSKSKVSGKDLEACIGLLMWATNVSPVLRPLLVPFYQLLNSLANAPLPLACGLYCYIA